MELKPKNKPMLRNGQTPPSRPQLQTSNRHPSNPSRNIGGCRNCRGGKK